MTCSYQFCDINRSVVLLHQHFEHWPKHLPLCAHAEGTHTAAVILLAELFKRPVHVCHVARKEEVGHRMWYIISEMCLYNVEKFGFVTKWYYESVSCFIGSIDVVFYIGPDRSLWSEQPRSGDYLWPVKLPHIIYSLRRMTLTELVKVVARSNHH